MKLYHGSNGIIDEIDLSKSKKGKDFGTGFYLSADKQQAMNMAKAKTRQLNVGEPTINSYEFDECFLTNGKLKVKMFDGYSIEWAEFVLANRTLKYTGVTYDIVVGPIADDKVGVQLRRLLQNYIDINTFIEELKYYKGITFQYFFGTELAISKLHKDG
jgi:hypothetical protein